MIDIFSRLSFKSESLDAAFYTPRSNEDSSLAEDLNILARQNRFGLSIEMTDSFGEKIILPTHGSLSDFSSDIVCFKKPTTTDSSYFISKQGLINNLGSRDISNYKCIYLLSDFIEFATLTCSFKVWKDAGEVPAIKSNLEPVVDPRNIVRDLTGSKITQNHLFWITHIPPSAGDEVLLAWLNFATLRSSALLLSEVSSLGGVNNLILKGSRNLEFSDAQHAEALTIDQHSSIHKALLWVFDSSREAETRHTLLAQRLTYNEPKKSESWLVFVARTIKASHAAAKDDYKNHLLIKTGDLLKAITDIRKTVSDEINKIVDKTNALTSNLLRDASISFLIVALRQTLINKNILTKEGASVLLMATVLWLITSVMLTGYQNKLYIVSQIRFRRNWSKGLSSLVPESELKKISKRPLRDAIKNYKKIKAIIGSIYATIVVVIVSILFFT